jgi:hypothetical protein
VESRESEKGGESKRERRGVVREIEAGGESKGEQRGREKSVCTAL